VVQLKWREAQALLGEATSVWVKNVSQERILIIDLKCYQINPIVLGVLLLDYDAVDFASVVYRLTEDFTINDDLGPML
jgi:hypothetical protein